MIGAEIAKEEALLDEARREFEELERNLRSHRVHRTRESRQVSVHSEQIVCRIIDFSQDHWAQVIEDSSIPSRSDIGLVDHESSLEDTMASLPVAGQLSDHLTSIEANIKQIANVGKTVDHMETKLILLMQG